MADPVAKARAGLSRAIDRLPMGILFEAAERIVRAEKGHCALERAGLTRSLGSHLETAVMCAEPDWVVARRLHRAWVASRVWDRAVSAVEKGVSRGA